MTYRGRVADIFSVRVRVSQHDERDVPVTKVEEHPDDKVVTLHHPDGRLEIIALADYLGPVDPPP